MGRGLNGWFLASGVVFGASIISLASGDALGFAGVGVAIAFFFIGIVL